MHFEDLDLGSDRVADEHGIQKSPVGFEKHRPGSGQIHRDDRVQQTAGQTALNDEFSKPRGGGELGINVKRVVVAGNLTVKTDAFCRECRGSCRLLPNCY